MISLLLYSCCPKPVQLSGLGTGTWLSHAQTSQITDSETTYYFTVGTSCYIISTVLWLDYLQSSVFISIYQTQMKLEHPQVEFAKQAYQFQNMFWENHDLTEQPVITSVYWVREVMRTWYCLSFFQTVL